MGEYNLGKQLHDPFWSLEGKNKKTKSIDSKEYTSIFTHFNAQLLNSEVSDK